MPNEFAGHTPDYSSEEDWQPDHEPEQPPYSGALPEKLWLPNAGSLIAFAGPHTAAQNIFEATWKLTSRVGDGTSDRGEAEAIAVALVERYNAAPSLLARAEKAEQERDALREALESIRAVLEPKDGTPSPRHVRDAYKFAGLALLDRAGGAL